MTGASGTVPCGIKCTVVAKTRGSRDLAALDDSIADITCSDPTKIILNEDRDVWYKVDSLKALAQSNGPHGPKAPLTRLAQGFGVKYCPEGILSDLELRAVISPTQANRFDPMHILYSNGIVGLEIHLFMSWLEETHQLGYENIGIHAAGFLFPKHVDKPRDVFTSERIRKYRINFKAGAGEVLGIYPVVRNFIEIHRLPQAAPIDSILKLFVVCDLLREAQYMAVSSPQPELVGSLCGKLVNAIRQHLDAFKAAHGCASVLPKHHMLMHVPDQILADGFMMWCFAPERLNFSVKRCVDHTTNTKQLERTCLAKSLNEQLERLKSSMPPDSFLKRPLTHFPELAPALGEQQANYSRAAHFRHSTICSTDLIILRGTVDKMFVLKFCAQAGDRKILFVQWCHSPEKMTVNSTRLRLAANVDAFELGACAVLHHAQCWRYIAADDIIACVF